MALWNILDAAGKCVGYRNSGETPDQAVREWLEDQCSTHFNIRFHDELPLTGTCENFRVAEANVFQKAHLRCDWRPSRPNRDLTAVRMKEIFMGGGYCKIPA